MDEFKPDNQPQGQNDLRPDTSDRPTGRSRQSSSTAKPKIALSRQHIMIGVGVLVLLLLIIAISSALKAPTEHEKQQTTGANNSQNIDLSGSSSLTNSQGQTLSGQPQEITGSQITPTPTQGEPQTQPNGLGERIEIPGDVVDALNQGQVSVPNTNQPQNTTQLTPPTVKPVEQQPVVKPVTPEKHLQNPLSKNILCRLNSQRNLHQQQVAKVVISCLHQLVAIHYNSAAQAALIHWKLLQKKTNWPITKSIKLYVMGKPGMFLFTEIIVQ